MTSYTAAVCQVALKWRIKSCVFSATQLNPASQTVRKCGEAEVFLCVCVCLPESGVVCVFVCFGHVFYTPGHTECALEPLRDLHQEPPAKKKGAQIRAQSV